MTSDGALSVVVELVLNEPEDETAASVKPADVSPFDLQYVPRLSHGGFACEGRGSGIVQSKLAVNAHREGRA